MVTRRGSNAVVLLAPPPKYRRLAGEDALVSLLLKTPRGEPLDTARSPEPVRTLTLG